ncbi:MAG: AraC family transcriptional regulator [Roseburia sp.]|nr:AraC family transcriptional regulator [Roseburia sp.]
MEAETDFYQRIRVFLDAYTKAEKKREKPYGKKELVLSVKQMVYESDGKIKISELEEKTGYTVRYINKVFMEEMGFSPKTFCKIIQFQRALEFLNYGAPDKMTDAAVALGYYDQSQFIRDFKKYAGMTPKAYFRLVESKHYKTKVKETRFLEE